MTRGEARQIIATWLVSSKGVKGQLGYIEGWFDEEDVEAFRMAIEALSDRPTGEWISNNDGSWNCSECGLRVFVYAKGNFCPNRGARMKGADDDL